MVHTGRFQCLVLATLFDYFICKTETFLISVWQEDFKVLLSKSSNFKNIPSWLECFFPEKTFLFQTLLPAWNIAQQDGLILEESIKIVH